MYNIVLKKGVSSVLPWLISTILVKCMDDESDHSNMRIVNIVFMAFSFINGT